MLCKINVLTNVHMVDFFIFLSYWKVFKILTESQFCLQSVSVTQLKLRSKLVSSPEINFCHGNIHNSISKNLYFGCLKKELFSKIVSDLLSKIKIIQRLIFRFFNISNLQTLKYRLIYIWLFQILFSTRSCFSPKCLFFFFKFEPGLTKNQTASVS